MLMAQPHPNYVENLKYKILSRTSAVVIIIILALTLAGVITKSHNYVFVGRKKLSK